MKETKIGKLLAIIATPTDYCNCQPNLILKPIGTEGLEASGQCTHKNSMAFFSQSIRSIEWECSICETPMVENSYGIAIYGIACEHHVGHGHFAVNIHQYKKLSIRDRNKYFHRHAGEKQRYIHSLTICTQ